VTAVAPIRLAVVDDSLFVRKAICRVMEDVPDVEIAGLAGSGEELLANLERWNPTAVTLDLSMPGMGGLATLDAILSWRSIPVLILSGSRREAPLALEALSRGAFDFVDKEQFSLVDFGTIRRVLLEHLRCAAERAPAEHVVRVAVAAAPVAPTGYYEAILIGASTGGPPAIERILRDLGPLEVPIAIAQHMPSGFTAAFAQRLDAQLPITVREAAHGMPLASGAYIAPGGMHLRLRREREHLTVSLARYPELSNRPSVDVLFRSAIPVAPRVIAVLLTGMGDDGARGLAELSAAGAATIAQDEATSVVYGMPRAAADLGAANEELPLDQIAARIADLVGA
jgi:two-component system chemotaxis response regulator CheB